MDIIRFIEEVEDPRDSWKIQHNLSSILFTTLCAVLSGAQTWDDVALFGQTKQAWLSKYISFDNGIPSAWTFRRIFTLLRPECLESLLRTHADQIMGAHNADHIAIDGKTLRSSKPKDLTCLHSLSAWCHEKGLVLAEKDVDKKSNEITAIPLLLNMLDLKGATVSIDAAGCQKTIASQIKEQKGDYVLALKKNHPKLYQTIEKYITDQRPSCDNKLHDVFDEGHGRLVRRRYLGYDISHLEQAKEWAGLRSVIAVETIVSQPNSSTHVTAQWRYYLSSHPANHQQLPAYIRNHWSVENKLHWVLDVHLKEDEDRKAERQSAKAFAILKRMSLNIIRSKDGHTKGSLRGKLKKASWDTNYLLSLLV